MPELPEVTALAAFLAEHATGQSIVAVNVASLNVLSTFDPPPSALVGRVVKGAGRHGKFLDLVMGPETDTAQGNAGGEADGRDLHLLVHLARAGWLRWSDSISAVPPKMGGPIALRVRFGRGGFDITEAGTKKSVAAAVVWDPVAVPGVARLGPDALSLDRYGLAHVLKAQTGRLKNVITDQTVIAGIGNAYSDEILHTAKLSPFATAGKALGRRDRQAGGQCVVRADRRREPIGGRRGGEAQGGEADRSSSPRQNGLALPRVR